MGSDAVVNLYGDLNQLACGYKGVSDWNELDEDGRMSRYVLRENYRNTIQVTDYCNNELGMDVTGVGLTGPAVETSSLEDAVKRLVALHAQHEGMRCAVIYSSKVKDRMECEPCLMDHSLEWGVVSSDGIAVISVEASKGLEFDAVVVVDLGMSRNEKYIACTRSIELLLVAELDEAVAQSEADEPISVSEELPVDSRGEEDVVSDVDSGKDASLFKPTLDYRASAKCVRHGDKIIGLAYAGTLPTSGDTTRYMCAECHDTVVPIDVARADFSGAETAGSTYSITIRPRVDSEQLRFLLMDGKHGGWYLTGEHEYTSPTYRNMKWHRKMPKIADCCPAGTMHVLEGDYDGRIVGQADFEWESAEEFMRIDTDFIKRAIRS